MTGVVHTNIDDIYDFFNKTVENGIMTHMLPRATNAIKPILIQKFPQLPISGFHPNIENPDELYEVQLTTEEKSVFWNNYSELPSPLLGKSVVTVIT